MSAALSMGDFIRPIINPYLTFVNSEFIPFTADKTDNQPMANEFSKTLLRLKEERRESWAKIGKAAGVTAQAAHKWGSGGNINDGQLEKLAQHFGITPSALKYGVEEADVPSALADHWAYLLPVERAQVEEEIKRRAEHNKAVLANNTSEIQHRTVVVSERRKSNLPFNHTDRREKHGS